MNENKELKSAYNYGRDSGYADGFVDGYKAGAKCIGMMRQDVSGVFLTDRQS